MKLIVKLVLATIGWLAFFEPNLIKPFAVLPVTTVMQSLTVADYLLWAVTLIVIEGIDMFLDFFFGKHNAPSTYQVQRPVVRKRGTWKPPR